MIYYGVSREALLAELHRRNYTYCGGHDGLCEGLQRLDEADGSDATTICTMPMTGSYTPLEEISVLRPTSRMQGQDDRPMLKMVKELRPRRAFGMTVDTKLLVGENITYWTLNTFFPTLNLQFESGLSCTIEGGALSSCVIGMDPALFTRLTDLSHEDDGCVRNTIIPTIPNPSGRGKFSVLNNNRVGIKILESEMARRTSVAVKQIFANGTRMVTIVHEEHVVVGLRLQGMSAMGYVWACVDRHEDGVAMGERTWGDVRVAGLVETQENAALPFIRGDREGIGQGGSVVVVEKKAMVKIWGRA